MFFYLALTIFYYYQIVQPLGWGAGQMITTLILLALSIHRLGLLILYYDLKIQVFSDRFLYTNQGETHIFLWDNITKILVFNYKIIGHININYIRVKIQDDTKNTIILTRTLRNVEKFEETVQEEIAKRKFPQIINALEKGMLYKNAGFVISQNKLKYNNKSIPWEQVGKMKIWQAYLRIWRRGKTLPSIDANIWKISILHLFIAVLEFMRNKQQDISPSIN